MENQPKKIKSIFQRPTQMLTVDMALQTGGTNLLVLGRVAPSRDNTMESRLANIDDLIFPRQNLGRRLDCIKRRSNVSSGPHAIGLQRPQHVYNLHVLGGQREGASWRGGGVAEESEVELDQDDRHQAKEGGDKEARKRGEREIDPTFNKVLHLF